MNPKFFKIKMNDEKELKKELSRQLEFWQRIAQIAPVVSDNESKTIIQKNIEDIKTLLSKMNAKKKSLK